MGSQGSQNPEIMEMLGFGLSHNKTKTLLDQIIPRSFYTYDLNIFPTKISQKMIRNRINDVWEVEAILLKHQYMD